MSPDNVDSLVLKIADWIDSRMCQPCDISATGMDWSPMEKDHNYEALSVLMHDELEKFLTRDRNYN